MAFTGKVLDKKIGVNDFIGNFKMLKYVAIVIPCLYYMMYESRSFLEFSSLNVPTDRIATAALYSYLLRQVSQRTCTNLTLPKRVSYLAFLLRSAVFSESLARGG